MCVSVVIGGAPYRELQSRKPIEHTCGQPRGTWRTCPCTLAAVAERKRRGVEGNRHTYRSSALKRRYGVTDAAYDRMREDQGYCCALCRRHEDGLPLLTTGRPRRDGSPAVNTVKLVVDHCHTSGATRRLVCHRCNIVIGYVEKHADLLA